MNAEGRPTTERPAAITDTVSIPRQAGRKTLPTVVPTAVYMTHGCRRVRLSLVVRCPHCERLHLHYAPLGFAEGKRSGGCHIGRYVVRVGIVAEVAA